MNAAEPERTFVLGVGAQKAGTTWLHRYLNSFAEVRMGVGKEYHIWNALHHDLCANQKLTLKKIFRTKPNLAFLPYPSQELLIRFLMQRFEGYYEHYFSNLARGRVRIAGDITPCYAGLDPHTFRTIKTRMESKGFRVKVVFLLSDPVERCWSAVRHHRRVLNLSGGHLKTERDTDHLRRAFRSDQMQFRTRYQQTITNLEAVFPREDTWIGLYETMFSEPEVRQLSAFLGIPANLDFTKNRVNASPKHQSSLDPGTAAMIRDFYSDVYDYCNERFPQTKELWRQPTGQLTSDILA
ncbi:hypothetical protein HFP89_14765 [Wenzhouxiangella sp. XN79A]|uniref:sulfotransferase domain-containing protein n=1 Tax=Wenzhouxiangella sp. XN79A TaxID=2724193 RepID=UPI00144AF1E7|nr:sulfotransferase domain-containing protein [Wenzhouxiangella sp. XN79A]NKI36430.1 hypothetical protein [Wenzhouxiangella sp. XN79A]